MDPGFGYPKPAGQALGPVYVLAALVKSIDVKLP